MPRRRKKYMVIRLLCSQVEKDLIDAGAAKLNRPTATFAKEAVLAAAARALTDPTLVPKEEIERLITQAVQEAKDFHAHFALAQARIRQGAAKADEPIT